MHIERARDTRTHTHAPEYNNCVWTALRKLRRVKQHSGRVTETASGQDRVAAERRGRERAVGMGWAIGHAGMLWHNMAFGSEQFININYFGPF